MRLDRWSGLLAAMIGICAAGAGHAQGFPTITPPREVVVDGVAAELNADTRFVRITSAGTIFVAQSNARNIHVFGPDGKRLAVFGRRGEGPGEFSSVWDSGLLGDSLWVSDVNLRRYTVITPQLKVGRIEAMPRPRLPREVEKGLPPLLATQTISILAGGTLAQGAPRTTDRYNEMIGALDVPGSPLFLADPKGNVRRLIGWRPEIRDRAQQGKVIAESPYPNVPLFAIAHDGTSFATATADLNEANATTTVTLVRSTGDTAWTRKLHNALWPIPDSVADAAYASREREIRRGKDATDRLAAMQKLPRVKYYPPLRSLTVSAGGEALIGFAADSPLRQYVLIDAAGRPVARVDLPRSATVQQLDPGIIWATDVDSDGVPSIVRFRVPALPRG